MGISHFKGLCRAGAGSGTEPEARSGTKPGTKPGTKLGAESGTESVAGTIAGDDTVFVVLRKSDDRQAVLDELNPILPGIADKVISD